MPPEHVGETNSGKPHTELKVLDYLGTKFSKICIRFSFANMHLKTRESAKCWLFYSGLSVLKLSIFSSWNIFHDAFRIYASSTWVSYH